MSIALSIANRRGACPTLDVPMQTGDGLLARIRLRQGRLAPAQLTIIADLAAEHGNGLIEITARGNLQVRGLTTASSAPFARAVKAIVDIEHGLVVETSPLAGDDPTELADPRPLAKAIREAAAPLSAQLGPKVTVVVDGTGQMNLAALKADIRLTAINAREWSLSTAGAPGERVVRNDAVSAVLSILKKIAALGPSARATDLVPHPQRHPRAGGDPFSYRQAWVPAGASSRARGDPRAGMTQSVIGHFTLNHTTATGIALPFGSVDQTALTALAAIPGLTEFRLAPHHCLLALDAPPAFLTQAANLGFITTASDPRLRISACIGSTGCASGHIPARADAARLAPHLASGKTLHISGCAKGCAHPSPADLTLTGRPDGYGLVIGGRASDTPCAVLRADQLQSALAGQG